MTNSFSERHKIIVPINLDPKDMPDALRNRLWNVIKDYTDELKSSWHFYGLNFRDFVIKSCWGNFFKQDVDTLKLRGFYGDGGFSIEQIKEKFYGLKWYGVYDFLEFLLHIYDGTGKGNFISRLNSIFLEERAPYKIIADMVTPLISEEEEVKEVEKAIESKYSAVSNHIKKAIDSYHKRPVADYANSIKESIHAVEALARNVLNKPGATLGQLSEKLNIHSSFRAAISKLYGWTNDESGIRHSEKPGEKLMSGEEEARYMLVVCSAFVNYISSKYEK